MAIRLVILLLGLKLSLSAQTLVGLSAQYADSFVAWDFIFEDADGTLQKGTLGLVWTHPDDWTQWQYQIGDHSGTIKTKWRNDRSFWELRGGNQLVTAQQTWTGDTRSWQVRHNGQSFTIAADGRAQLWQISDSPKGHLELGISYENSLLDWEIDDGLSAETALEAKLMLVFIGLFNSIPKT